MKEKGEGVHEGLGRPDLLITDTDRVGWKNVKRRERDGALLGELTFLAERSSFERLGDGSMESREDDVEVGSV